MSKVKNIGLAKQGRDRIDWAENRMPVLVRIRKRFEKEKPLNGLTVACCLHVTKETGVLMRTLRAGGAEVVLCGSNPLSTQDDVAAALLKEGIHVFAWRGVSNEEYYWCIDRALDMKPNITMDDGGDLVAAIHSNRSEILGNVLGGTEETTTGVIRFRAMEKNRALKYPVIAVNDAYTKHLFDNRYGTGQSTIDGVMRSTSILLTGKNFVVGGYGWCGRGVAMRARGMGSNVIVTEVDPIKALEALMDGFRVMPMAEAAAVGDVFVTVTGNRNVLTAEHVKKMKDGAILANSGHFNVEIDIPGIERIAKRKKQVRPGVEEYVLRNRNRVYILAQGRLVNLAAAEGHPSEVMQMSFGNQALCAEYIAKGGNGMRPGVCPVPKEIDMQIASIALECAGVKIDRLTKEQKRYISSWKEGT